ncbi:MAG: GlcNAc-PI de-N-acetylase [Candidatus Aminicenantes bacterium RBG_13_59_9]|nr:MAG: GlcNAc-PI de-N-acetylase [Candidatus Aminicenantes bacterium RBG_13_59_9]
MPKLRKTGSELFIPDGLPLPEAIKRTTYLGVASHPDDLEIMAYHGILKCFSSEKDCFFGVIATDGAGSPRDGFYKRYTDEEMKVVRKKEQKKAALVGEYGGVAFLNYTSSEVKDARNTDAKDDIRDLLMLARPRVLYTHNPADKHDTHVAVGLRAIQALRELPAEMRPETVYGCEVWRDLDWMLDEDKIGLDVSDHQNLATSLVSVFDSQVAGGKGYDMATIGRRRAHATYYTTHGVDVASSMIFAMDLTALITDPSLDIKEFVCRYINRFAADVSRRIDKLL